MGGVRALSDEAEYWRRLIGGSPLGVLTDLDGTLLPFGATPEDSKPGPEVQELLRDVTRLPGVQATVVSGRPREWLDTFFPRDRVGCGLVAEHGAWRRLPGAEWEATVSLDAHLVDALEADLRRLLARYPATLLERKTWTVAFHFRRISTLERAALLVEVESIVTPWIEAHPAFERLWGAEVIEVRPREARKRSAALDARARLGPGCRLVLLGDDITDEDMFGVASADDAAVLVGGDIQRPTNARWRLDSPARVHDFLRWMIAARGGRTADDARLPRRVSPQADVGNRGLLVVTNRLPELPSLDGSRAMHSRNVGGVVSALEPVVAARDALWLGWSGRSDDRAEPSVVRRAVLEKLPLAWIDLPAEWERRYYRGFSNQALWPLFHSMPAAMTLSNANWDAYQLANDAFAVAALSLVTPAQAIWVQDYQLWLVGRYLRARGHSGPIGFFQHIPFPGPDLLFLLPWAAELLKAALEYDLVGFYTRPYVENFLRCVARLPGASVDGDTVRHAGRATLVKAFPLGIVPEDFRPGADAPVSAELEGLVRSLGTRQLILGVERLDYTKGIPERLEAFGHLLATVPEWRGKVCFVQISVPSRANIDEYKQQRDRVESVVGRVNGEFGDAEWVPIRYLYRSYGRADLCTLYRTASVGCVTPLRDGMNLVAKEFVAAQDPAKPGVLLLSQFAGAAEELRDALLTNPWHREGLARDLDRALRMPLDERKRRHASMFEVIRSATSLTWANDFLASLGVSRGS